MKKLLSLLVIFFILTICSPVWANEEISVYLNNEKLEFDVPPTVVNQRVMVPMRHIFEKLGAEVEWYGETGTATASIGKKYISLTIGSPYMDTDRDSVKLDVPAMATEGRTLVPLRAISEAFGSEVKWDGENNSVIIYSEDYIDYTVETAEQTTVEVATAAELLNAVGSNRKIILTSDCYNLADAENTDNEFVERQPYWDGTYLDAYIIKNVVNMTIEGNAKIVVDEINADVLKFEKCGKITLSGLTVGHTEPAESYRCEGAVLRFNTCDSITVINCNLYGCGAFGIYADNTSAISVNSSKIYDCSYTGIWLTNQSEATVENTEFFDSHHSSGFLRIDSSVIDLKNCNIHNIVCTGSGSFIDTFDSYGNPSLISLTGCTFKDNEFNTITNGSPNLTFTDSIFENNKGSTEHPSVTYSNCEIK